MNKLRIWAAVWFAAAILSLSTGALAAEGPPANIALNRAFRCSVPLLEGWTGLVDGDTESDTAPGCFATANVPIFPKYVTIDLGAVCTVKQVVVFNSANGNTRKISIECSRDGQNFDTLRDAYIFPNKDPMKLSHEFAPRKARYVRITLHNSWEDGIGGDNCIFLREVQVMGWHPDGIREQPADPLGQFSEQSMAKTGQSVDIFRRYCLGNAETPLQMAIFGDSFARPSAGSDVHWGSLVAERLRETYDKPVSFETVSSMSFAAADAEIAIDQAKQEFDLIILSMGFDAAVGEEPMGRLQSSVAAILDLLRERTDAMVVIVTPPPIAHDKTMKNYELAKGLSTREYAWELHQLAGDHMVPVIMTGPLLASSTADYKHLYADNLSLSERGHETLARGIVQVLSAE